MASDVVIRAEGLGKKYVIGHQAAGARNGTFRDMLVRNMRNWGRSARDMMRGRAIVAGDETEEFWALKDVDFEIRRGEVVGVIGRNGAGKSTLLKILSRITEPTEGRVMIDGRVASLLEVGTGFHPELTGRENIYLNGAILGMTRGEIKRKFDEIVDFAGVERFLDTPVKRYSSGMYVRLAFAVAAHLEPEILIVDEVLAVGDAEFQKKCLSKMKDVSKQERTVLIVSHNMDMLQRLCETCILLDGGKLALHKSASLALRFYESSMSATNSIQQVRNRKYEASSELISFNVTHKKNNLNKEEAYICMEIMPRDYRGREFAILVHGEKQEPLFCSHSTDLGHVISSDKLIKFEILLPIENMRSGRYYLSFSSCLPGRTHFFDVVGPIPIEVISQTTPSSAETSRWGQLYFPLNWNHQ